MMNINTVMAGNLTPFDFDVEEEIQKLLEDKDCNILIPIKLFCVFLKNWLMEISNCIFNLLSC